FRPVPAHHHGLPPPFIRPLRPQIHPRDLVTSIHVLVLNYNGLGLLKECLPSVWEACLKSPVPCKLSVVDNASTDGSSGWLKSSLPEVGWIAASENRILFSYNAVVAQVPEDAVLLLNNDIKVEPDFI